MTKTLYEILGVAEDAPVDEIKSAYRRLAHEHHPDKRDGDADKFNEVTRAYKILIDPGSRLLYDNTGDTEKVDQTQEVENIVLSAFQDALNSDSHKVLDHAKDFIKKHMAQYRTNRQAILTKRSQVEQKKNLIITNEEKNLWTNLVNQILKVIEKDLREVDKHLANGEAALNILEAYNSLEEVNIGGKVMVQWFYASNWEDFSGAIDDALKDAQDRKKRVEEFERRQGEWKSE